MGKVLHKFFKDFLNKLNNALPNLGEPVSEVSHLLPEPSNFSEVIRFPADIKKAWLKTTLKSIKNIIKNQTFLAD